MRGQPEVGVEHGLQHFKGVATGTQKLGDEQRQKSRNRGNGVAGSALVEKFNHHAEPCASPANEYSGGIKVGNGRPSLQVHTHEQSNCVNAGHHDGGCQNTPLERDELFGTKHPAGECCKQHAQIKHARQIDGIDGIVSLFHLHLGHGRFGNAFFKDVVIGGQLLVEVSRFLICIGQQQTTKRLGCRIVSAFTGGNHGFLERHPAIGGGFTLCCWFWWNKPCFGNRKRGDLDVKFQMAGQLQKLPLIDIAAGRIDFGSLAGSFFDISHAFAEFGNGVSQSLTTFNAKQSEDLIVLYTEYLEAFGATLVRQPRRHDVEKPFGGWPGTAFRV